MDSSQYSDVEKKDIEDRVEKANAMLLELKLQPGVVMQAVNIGDDVFGVKPIAYLQDTLYTPNKSPIQEKDL
jgi:hypothetical protein